MNKYLKDSENIDLSSEDILNITNNETSIITYQELENIQNIDELFTNKDVVTILYQTKQDFGHWVCLIKHSSSLLEFFDPYGLNIDEELSMANYNLRLHEGVRVPHLTNLINKSNYNVIYNKAKLQQFIEHINTCGRHVSVRIKMKHMKLYNYVKLMTSDKCLNPDEIVSLMTILYSLK